MAAAATVPVPVPWALPGVLDEEYPDEEEEIELE